MNKRQQLENKLLYFNPEIVFDGTIGGIKLVMKVDSYSEQINWSVCEGDHYTEFSSFNEACDYYLNAIGEE